MRNRTLADLDRVVALGGGHGLGRVLSSLSSLGSRLTGIVTTTDNGGSTPRIRPSEGRVDEGDSGTGQAGDKAVALRGGDAKTRRCGAVDDDGEQRRAQAGERHGAVSAKVDDM